LDNLERKPLPEPEFSPDDTQPRRPVVVPPDTSDSADEAPGEQPAGGCGNRLLVVLTVLALFLLFAASVGLSGLAGWRDGVVIMQTRKAATLVAYVGGQATLAHDDCDQGHYELCYERCKFIATQQPFYPGMDACMSYAQLVLSVTPTTLPSVAPPTPTLGPTLSVTTGDGGDYSLEDLFARAQEAVRTSDYESAMKWLEALRGKDAEFHRKEVEDLLVKTYQALGNQYKYEGRLSEMIIVIRKALKIRPLPDTDWEFTINAAELYLSAKGYLDAQNYALAASVFGRLMDIAPTFMDTKTLACQAFSGAGDTAAFAKYCQ
jgi:tetratricopeptide (TPR) repeat protein